MPLSQADRDNLVRLGKQAKEINFPPQILAEDLAHNRQNLFRNVEMIFIRDDGQIDPEEGKLMLWVRDLFLRLEYQNEEIDIWEAEHWMLMGYYDHIEL